MAKLFASDVAVWVTPGRTAGARWLGLRRGVPHLALRRRRHVLPIFEGVKPILELKVIARQLLAG